MIKSTSYLQYSKKFFLKTVAPVILATSTCLGSFVGCLVGCPLACMSSSATDPCCLCADCVLGVCIFGPCIGAAVGYQTAIESIDACESGDYKNMFASLQEFFIKN